MTIKEYLMQYQRLTWEIERLDRDIKAIEDSIDDMSTNYDGLPRSSKISKRPEEIAVRLTTAKNKRLKRKQRAIRFRQQISDNISKIDNAMLSQLLYDRYIELMTWEEVAEDIEMSERWTRTELHSRALKALAKIVPLP